MGQPDQERGGGVDPHNITMYRDFQLISNVTLHLYLIEYITGNENRKQIYRYIRQPLHMMDLSRVGIKTYGYLTLISQNRHQLWLWQMYRI